MSDFRGRKGKEKKNIDKAIEVKFGLRPTRATMLQLAEKKKTINLK